MVAVKKHKLIVLFLTILFLACAVVIIVNLRVGVQLKPVPGKVFQITDNLGSQNAYLASSNLVVFDEEKTNDRFEAYKHDIQLGTSASISSSSANTSFNGDANLLSSSEYAVWYDVRNVSAGNTTWDVYASNISTGTERRVTSAPIDVSSLSVSGHYCIYINNTQDYGIYICDLSSTNNPTRIFAFDSPSRSFMRIGKYNNVYYIVFEDTNNFKRDIKMYNVSTQAITTIANSSNVEHQPVLCGDSVFYVEKNKDETLPEESTGYTENGSISIPPSGVIKRYNIDSAVTVSIYDIDSGKYIFLLPSDSSVYLGFLDKKALVTTIKYINLQNNSVSTVATDSEGFMLSAVSGCISGNYFVYEFYPFANSDPNALSKIRVFDIAKNSTTDIRTTEHSISCPRISGNTIIWKESYIDGKKDVAHYQLYGYIMP